MPRALLATLIVAWSATVGWHTGKPLVAGVRVEGAYVPVEPGNVRFLADVTSADAFGQRLASQQIFDATLSLVRESQGFLIVDYFLFNEQDGAGLGGPPLRPLSGELRDALLARHAAEPAMPILVVVDPVNASYGPRLPPGIQALRNAGIDVVLVDLDALRDSNAGYSALWRLLARWWLEPSTDGGIANPLDVDAEPISVGAYARLLNFKANHRKVVLTRTAGGQLRGIVGSANPHDASSAHSNVALEVRGPSLQPLLDSELAIARNGGWRGSIDATPATVATLPAAPLRVAALTEGAILDGLLAHVDAAAAGDTIDVAMFYLTEREVIESLIAASRRGAVVRVLLDPNKDAFGYEKSGLPNRPVASELLASTNGALRVRWYRTHGEQFHAKLALIRSPRAAWLTLGSANFTRRNLSDYNLEANLAVEAAPDAELVGAVQQWFDTLWNNRAAVGVEYSADAEVYADPSQGRYWLYRLMEGTGLSTF